MPCCKAKHGIWKLWARQRPCVSRCLLPMDRSAITAIFCLNFWNFIKVDLVLPWADCLPDCTGTQKTTTAGSRTTGSARLHNRTRSARTGFSFWRHRRLAHQLRLAKHNCAPNTLLEHGEHLLCDMDGLFENYSPESSLLHGDLWSGNFAFDAKARPVVCDPACYYGGPGKPISP